MKERRFVAEVSMQKDGDQARHEQGQVTDGMWDDWEGANPCESSTRSISSSCDEEDEVDGLGQMNQRLQALSQECLMEAGGVSLNQAGLNFLWKRCKHGPTGIELERDISAECPKICRNRRQESNVFMVVVC
ncbi:hypothetical protein VNO78_25475 [Psophocarpus tetragonolobus]|uniref:Uncharacterized protein n=1 Tax=Psophocarpus tetragonolobus TaxID=3891 RepID=A0AAN9S7V4_PSOTE